MTNLRLHSDDRNSASSEESRFQAILHAAVDGIISIGARGEIQTVNPAAEKMFGYAEKELVGANIKILMPAPFKEEHDGYLENYLKTGRKKIIGIGREVVGQRKDGTTFPMDLSVAEAQLRDERIFIGIIRDITERKAAEEALSRLAAIIETSDDAIVGKALDGTIITWNAGAEKMFGYEADFARGRNISFLVPPERQDEVSKILTRIGQGERIDHYETVRLTKDGRKLDVSVTISPIKDASGKILGASTIKRDITAQKRANEEIRAMTQQLWQAAKLASVGELAASIAHELNNPLATVILRIESVLARLPQDDPARRSLEIINQESKRMGDLVANLLQFSRRGDGHSSSLDLCDELGKSLELIQHLLRKRQIQVHTRFAADTPTIFADRQKLRQVFLNLLTNASDAMPQGGDLTVRTSPAYEKGELDAVAIEIEDTGQGIPSDHFKSIMEPFFTTKEEGKGTGLGLAICRRVMEEHEGTIEFESEVAKGTIVRLILPTTKGTNAARLRQAPPRPER